MRRVLLDEHFVVALAAVAGAELADQLETGRATADDDDLGLSVHRAPPLQFSFALTALEFDTERSKHSSFAGEADRQPPTGPMPL
jgi:hypothetical protein